MNYHIYIHDLVASGDAKVLADLFALHPEAADLITPPSGRYEWLLSTVSYAGDEPRFTPIDKGSADSVGEALDEVQSLLALRHLHEERLASLRDRGVEEVAA